MKTAVVTIAAGRRIEPIAEISIPLMMKYAQRIGSDFICLSPAFADQFLGIINYEKLQAFSLLRYYDRVAYIDADTLISPRAESLFEVVDSNHLGVFIASRYSDGHNPSIEAIQSILGEIPWRKEARNPCIYESFNSGVMVLSRESSQQLINDLPLAERWAQFNSRGHYYSDQPFLNYVVQKCAVPLTDIGYRFNHTLASGNSAERFRSDIIHYAGTSHQQTSLFLRPSKSAKMGLDRRILNSRRLLRLASSYPFLVAFMDQII